jgi:hypothetical protein
VVEDRGGALQFAAPRWCGYTFKDSQTDDARIGIVARRVQIDTKLKNSSSSRRRLEAGTRTFIGFGDGSDRSTVDSAP